MDTWYSCRCVVPHCPLYVAHFCSKSNLTLIRVRRSTACFHPWTYSQQNRKRCTYTYLWSVWTQNIISNNLQCILCIAWFLTIRSRVSDPFFSPTRAAFVFPSKKQVVFNGWIYVWIRALHSEERFHIKTGLSTGILALPLFVRLRIKMLPAIPCRPNATPISRPFLRRY